jgi:hypothetical protein
MPSSAATNEGRAERLELCRPATVHVRQILARWQVAKSNTAGQSGTNSARDFEVLGCLDLCVCAPEVHAARGLCRNAKGCFHVLLSSSALTLNLRKTLAACRLARCDRRRASGASMETALPNSEVLPC